MWCKTKNVVKEFRVKMEIRITYYKQFIRLNVISNNEKTTS